MSMKIHAIRQVSEQLKVIGDSINALRIPVSQVQKSVLPLLAKDHAVIAIPNPRNYGMLATSVALEVWSTYSSLSKLISGMHGVKGTYKDFRADLFRISPRTKSSLESIEHMQQEATKILVFPVRWKDSIEEPLLEDEFYLDISSTLWVLITHWHMIRGLHVQKFEIVCAGEEYSHDGTWKHPMLTVLGFNHDSREMLARDRAYLSQSLPVLVGCVPAQH